MTNKELKEKHKKLLNVINKKVNDCDPIGKLPSATGDEYEFEIAKIVTLLKKVESVNFLSNGIATIFTRAFDFIFTKDDCLPVAQKIWRETKSYE